MRRNTELRSTRRVRAKVASLERRKATATATGLMTSRIHLLASVIAILSFPFVVATFWVWLQEAPIRQEQADLRRTDMFLKMSEVVENNRGKEGKPIVDEAVAFLIDPKRGGVDPCGEFDFSHLTVSLKSKITSRRGFDCFIILTKQSVIDLGRTDVDLLVVWYMKDDTSADLKKGMALFPPYGGLTKTEAYWSGKEIALLNVLYEGVLEAYTTEHSFGMLGHFYAYLDEAVIGDSVIRHGTIKLEESHIRNSVVLSSKVILDDLQSSSSDTVFFNSEIYIHPKALEGSEEDRLNIPSFLQSKLFNGSCQFDAQIAKPGPYFNEDIRKEESLGGDWRSNRLYLQECDLERVKSASELARLISEGGPELSAVP